MANYTIAAGDIAVHAKVLAADTEDVVTFGVVDGEVSLILHPGSNTPVYISTGSVAATVAGPKTRILFPGWSGTLTGPDGVLKGLDGAATDPPTKVRLISEGEITYSVEI